MADNLIDGMVNCPGYAERLEVEGGTLIAPAPNAESALAIAGQYAA